MLFSFNPELRKAWAAPNISKNWKELQFVVMEVLACYAALKIFGVRWRFIFNDNQWSLHLAEQVLDPINQVSREAVRSKTDRSPKDFPKHGERWEKEAGWRWICLRFWWNGASELLLCRRSSACCESVPLHRQYYRCCQSDCNSWFWRAKRRILRKHV